MEEKGGGAILYEENFGKGRLIVTTLDPFYHTGSNFMPNAAKFLAGILAWVKKINLSSWIIKVLLVYLFVLPKTQKTL